MIKMFKFLYILIIIAFQKAKVKYSGGKIGDVINLKILRPLKNLSLVMMQMVCYLTTSIH